MDSQRFWILPEEKLNICDDPEGHIVDGQLVEAERQRPAPLEPAHRPLDDVSLPVRGFVEVRVARLILPRRDHRIDVPPLQPAAHAGVAVPLVPRPLLRPALLTVGARPQVALDDASLIELPQQGVEDVGPGAVLAPAVEAVVDGLPGPVALRGVGPGSAGVQVPEDAVDEAAVVLPGMAAVAVVVAVGEEAGNALPLGVGKVIAVGHGGLLEETSQPAGWDHYQNAVQQPYR